MPKQFPFGRWNREQPHTLEIRYDGPGCWAVCSCGYEGELRRDTAQADQDAIGHEQYVFAVHRQGKRLIRGGVE